MLHQIPTDKLGATGPAMGEAVGTCVHCGFCLPACPTYRVLGEEQNSPRGRIILMKEVLEGKIEPEDAQAHYTEKLVALPHLGVHISPGAVVGSSAVEVEGEGPLLLCPGTPFKYAPRFDRVLVDIARGLGKCRMVFFTSKVQALSHKLRARLERAGLDFGRHARFLRYPSRESAYVTRSRTSTFPEAMSDAGTHAAASVVPSTSRTTGSPGATVAA